ncbi:MAG TPA: serine/threonine-protein kinase [Candidatus Limnocylindria bacterium]|jgi:serine/threonine protein kinase/Tfp pilus assembly protein PilF|nr:serine/threonine-protein kinase [Candidatus Limnocylindria bacterium]
MTEEFDRDLAVFTAAVQMSADARAVFLDQACKGDDELRLRIEALLRAHEGMGDFLDVAPPGIAPRQVYPPLAGMVPGEWIGHYTLVRQIGEGGCGVVYEAEQEKPVRRRVALKIIKPGMDTQSVIARFEAERQALAMMDHPNIAKVFDAGATESGRPYFVMELVRGVKITDYCDQKSLTTVERLELFVVVCHAVQHAHQKGIIHRDIKPSNILVTEMPDGVALPVVIDFGIAKATTNQPLTDKTVFTALEMLIGTPAYMSPEQAALASPDVDTRSDIYSLGVLFYELLTGSTPFDTRELLKEGLDEIRRVIREEEPLRPSVRLSRQTPSDQAALAQHRKTEPPRLTRTLHGDLDWIAIKALEKDRTRRYATANDLALDVKRYLAHEPISARPPSKLYLFGRVVRRHRLLFIAIGLVVALFLAGLIIVSASLARERRESAKSQQITRFLENMLQSAGPSVALGQDTALLRGILDRTAERVTNELANQPAIEMELLRLTGQIYQELAEYPKAEATHRAALALARPLYGLESDEAATSLNDLGLALWREGKLPEAETAHREALVLRRRHRGNRSREVAASLVNLANVYRHAHQPGVAVPLVQEALGIQTNLLGMESRETADSLRVLSILLGDQGKRAEAEVMARRVLEIRRKLLHPDDPLIAASLADVGWTIVKQEKWSQGEPIQREALALRLKLFGHAHPSTIESLNSLCWNLEHQRKYPEAEALHRQGLAFWVARGEGETAPALSRLDGLMRDLLVEKKLAETEQILNTALTPSLLGKTSCVPFLKVRLDLLARRRQWPEAAVDAALLLQYDSADLYRYHQLAGTLAGSHNRPAYDQLCQKIISQFADTTNRDVAERMAQVCLLYPDSVVASRLVEKMVDTAVTVTNGQPEYAFGQVCKAMACYRMGRYPEAIVWADKAVQGPYLHAQGKAYAVLAMAQWKLGQQDTAHAMLAKGDALVPHTPAGRDTGEDLGAWVGWIFARVSLDEAVDLINPAKLETGKP